MLHPLTGLRRLHGYALAAGLLAFSAAATAQVDVRNGNFAVTYRDIRPSADGDPLELRRTYNSLSGERGWFGVGWGSLFETRLITFTDGSAMVRENGSGAFTYYGAPAAADIARTAKQIAAAVAQHDTLDAAARDYLAYQLQDSAELRARKAVEYGVRNTLLPTGPLSTGRCDDGRLIPERANYLRINCDGSQDRFDAEGRLLARAWRPGVQISIARNNKGEPVDIRDERGNTIALTWTANGQIASATGRDKQRMQYRYDNDGNLAGTSGTDDEPAYRFEYGKHHHLTAIHYIDTTTRLFAHDHRGRITRQTERTGEVTVYAYPAAPKDVGLDQTTVTRYDNEGNIIPSATRRYAWENRSGKLVRYTDTGGHWGFSYDEDGHLQRAEGSEGTTELAYGATGRIARIRLETLADAAPRELRYAYLPDGQVSRIELVGTGTVTLGRAADGNPAVEDESAPGTALRINAANAAFQRVTKPLNMQAPR